MHLMNEKKIIIWDIDGTLLDTAPGIIHSVRFAEENCGLTPLDANQIRAFLGPPPKLMYMKMYGISEKKAAEAVRFHRQYSREEAIFEAEVYDGIPEVLEFFKSNGKKQAVATLKGQYIADSIIEKMSLADYFDIIAAMDKNETKTKSRLLRDVIEYFELSNSDAVLIGDSKYDAVGAEEAGVDFVGVTYGFGFHSADDVKQYPNIGIANSVDDLWKLNNGMWTTL